MEEDRQTANQTAKRSGKAALLLIFLTVFIDLVGFGLIIPGLPTYAQSLKASDFTVGLLISSYSFMQFFFTPFWGRLSDRVGRRPILIISLCFSALGYLLWGMSHDLVMLFASRMIAGFGNANIAVAQAYVSDVTTEENRAKGMGLIGAAFGLGFVIGPAIGCGLAAAGLGLEALGFAAAAMSLLDLILVLLILPEPEKRSDAGTARYGQGLNFYWNTLKDKQLRVSFLIFFLSTFAFANMEATLVLFTNKQFQFDNLHNMLMFTYIGVLMVIVQGGMIHRLVKKYGEKRLITAGTALIAIGLALTPLTDNVVVLYIALAILAVGTGINTPANQSVLSKLAPQATVGGVMGVGQSISTLGRILGPAIGCLVFQTVGVFSPYALGATVMVAAIVASTFLPEPSQKGNPAPKPEPKPEPNSV